MKKILIIVCAAVCVFSFMTVASCNKKDKGNSNTITISQSAVELSHLEEATLTAQVKDKEGNEVNAQLEWSSSEPARVSVAGGKIKGLKIGAAVITVKGDGLEATCAVNVTSGGNIAVTVLNTDEVPIFVGGTFNLSASISFGGKPYNDGVFAYKSANTAIATITDSGVISGVTPGETLITVTGEWGGHDAVGLTTQIRVTVKEKIVSGFDSLEPITLYTSAIENHKTSERLIAVVTDDDTNLTVDGENTEWKISTEVLGLITVNDGQITANTTGKTGTAKVYYEFTSEFGSVIKSPEILVTVDMPVLDRAGVIDKGLSGGKVLLTSGDLGYDESKIVNVYIDGAEQAYDNGFIATRGRQEVIVSNSDYYSVKVDIFVYDLMINTVVEFKSIADNLDWYYALGKDIDFTGVTDFQTIGLQLMENSANGTIVKGPELPFSGILNGRGFGLLNLKMTHTRALEDNPTLGNLAGEGSLFIRVTGEIKNIYIDFTVLEARSGAAPQYQGAIAALADYGKITNVYGVIKGIKANAAGYPGFICTVVGNNTTVSNCIVDSQAVAVQPYGSVVGYSHSNRVDTISNCYGIVSRNLTYSTANSGANAGATVLYSKNGATRAIPIDSANYIGFSGFTENVNELSAADGWSEYWSYDGASLKFGERTIF